MSPVRALLAALVLAPATGCAGTVRLHAPALATTAPREGATAVDVDAIVLGPGVVPRISTGETIVARPDAASVLTAAMRAELAARSLAGGDAPSYVVRCTVERFAIRDTKSLTARAEAILYVDASCDVAHDGGLVWRGELRGRAFAKGGASLDNDASGIQRLVDRMMSDASREMASDLAVRVLGLRVGKSERVFDSEDARASLASVDDEESLGTLALGERYDEAVVGPALHDAEARKRAAAWNVVAMASGPGEPWTQGDTFVRDDDDGVRFYQLKALARAASPVTLAQLQAAALAEGDGLLAELASDALATGGIGLPRKARAKNGSAVTNGTTARP